MINHGDSKRLIEKVKSEVKPAIGCTEPVAVAYAAASGAKYIKGDLESVEVNTSVNIFKNGKSVTIPGTWECGLDLAAALGIICGDSNEGLCVFKNVNDKYLSESKELIKRGIIKVKSLPKVEGVYVEVKLKTEKSEVISIVKDSHTHLYSISVDGSIIYEDAYLGENKKENEIKGLNFKVLREIAEQCDYKDIKFVLEGVSMNKHAADLGLKKQKGFNLGAALLKIHDKNEFITNPSIQARILTAAGADFRMGGGNSPIMTSGGSGNQGLGVILPIYVVSEKIGATEEKLARAIFFAHSVNIYIKSYVGKLSSMCGCAIAAGVGASAAITWLLGGDDRQISGAVSNMLANLTGMICDGAKESCASKLSTSAGEAVIAAYLAMDDVIVPNKTGIISDCVEDTIKNIETFCKDGLNNADGVLMDIICSN